MENKNEPVYGDVEPQQIISANKFALLCFLTFGLYELWWMYKAWRFFQQKEKWDIMPAGRALLSIFFLYALLNEIHGFAATKGYQGRFSPLGLYIGFLIVNLANGLSETLWLLSLLSFIFLIPPFKAFNFAKQNSDEFVVNEQHSFNGRQIILIIIGIISWGILLSELLR